MGLNTVRSCRKQLQRFARVMRVELFGALLRRYVGYPPEIRPNPGTWYSRGAALILAKRRADAGAVTTYHRRVPSRPGVRPAVPGAGFTRAKQKGEGR